AQAKHVANHLANGSIARGETERPIRLTMNSRRKLDRHGQDGGLAPRGQIQDAKIKLESVGSAGELRKKISVEYLWLRVDICQRLQQQHRGQDAHHAGNRGITPVTAMTAAFYQSALRFGLRDELAVGGKDIGRRALHIRVRKRDELTFRRLEAAVQTEAVSAVLRNGHHTGKSVAVRSQQSLEHGSGIVR